MSRDRQAKPRNKLSAAHQQEESGTDFERIIFFSDAVFAIAITLLVLEIRIPEIESETLARDLPNAILGLIPRFIVYAFSFLIVAHYWVAHHRLFRFIRRYDASFIWLNILFLLCVAFLPVPSAVVSRYLDQPAAVTFASICLTITSLMATILWIYASNRHRLIDTNLDPDLNHRLHIRGWFSVIVFGIASIVAFANANLAVLLLIAFFVLSSLLGRWYYSWLLRIFYKSSSQED